MSTEGDAIDYHRYEKTAQFYQLNEELKEIVRSLQAMQQANSHASLEIADLQVRLKAVQAKLALPI